MFHPIGIDSSRRDVVVGFNREPKTMGERCAAQHYVAMLSVGSRTY